jgi:hypothetical protein
LVNGECKVQNSIFVHTLIKLLKIVQWDFTGFSNIIL